MVIHRPVGSSHLPLHDLSRSLLGIPPLLPAIVLQCFPGLLGIFWPDLVGHAPATQTSVVHCVRLESFQLALHATLAQGEVLRL